MQGEGQCKIYDACVSSSRLSPALPICPSAPPMSLVVPRVSAVTVAMAVK